MNKDVNDIYFLKFFYNVRMSYRTMTDYYLLNY